MLIVASIRDVRAWNWELQHCFSRSSLFRVCEEPIHVGLSFTIHVQQLLNSQSFALSSFNLYALFTRNGKSEKLELKDLS